jgi:hypothetical protein
MERSDPLGNHEGCDVSGDDKEKKNREPKALSLGSLFRVHQTCETLD